MFFRDPNPVPELGTWPQFTTSKKEYLDINTSPTVRRALKSERGHFWNDYLPKLISGHVSSKCPDVNTASSSRWSTTHVLVSVLVVSAVAFIN
jgi:hypothetical protein